MLRVERAWELIKERERKEQEQQQKKDRRAAGRSVRAQSQTVTNSRSPAPTIVAVDQEQLDPMFITPGLVGLNPAFVAFSSGAPYQA